jgi:2-dehydropantoate 2-reductase
LNVADLRFAVVGAGGVGGFFGAQLHKGGASVRFLARGAHLEAMQAHGLRVHSRGTVIDVPGNCFFDSPTGIGPVDVVLFCVKSYDTEVTARAIKPMVHDSTIIISLQNGVDNEEIIARAIQLGAVFGGLAYIFATISAPGEITEWGGPKKIVFGPLRNDAQLIQKAAAILQSITQCGVDAELAEDIAAAIWSKFTLISAVGGLTALTRLTLGQILENPESHALLLSAMEETFAVAKAIGVGVAPTLIDDTFARLAKFENNSRSSLYVDLVNERRIEIDALSGTVMRLGQQHGVLTPIHSLIYAALIPHHRMALRRLENKKS